MYLIEKADQTLGFENALKSAGYLNPFESQSFNEIDAFIKGVGAVGGENNGGGADNL